MKEASDEKKNMSFISGLSAKNLIDEFKIHLLVFPELHKIMIEYLRNEQNIEKIKIFGIIDIFNLEMNPRFTNNETQTVPYRYVTEKGKTLIYQMKKRVGNGHIGDRAKTRYYLKNLIYHVFKSFKIEFDNNDALKDECQKIISDTPEIPWLCRQSMAGRYFIAKESYFVTMDRMESIFLEIEEDLRLLQYEDKADFKKKKILFYQGCMTSFMDIRRRVRPILR